MYNIDYYYEAFPIDWTESYNIKNECKKIETTSEFYSELSNRYKNSNKFYFLDNMQSISINGSIKKLQKWVIEGCWNIIQSNNKKSYDIIIANKITKKKSIKKPNYDISGSYNLGLTSNKIKINYTTNQTIPDIGSMTSSLDSPLDSPSNNIQDNPSNNIQYISELEEFDNSDNSDY